MFSTSGPCGSHNFQPSKLGDLTRSRKHVDKLRSIALNSKQSWTKGKGMQQIKITPHSSASVAFFYPGSSPSAPNQISERNWRHLN